MKNFNIFGVHGKIPVLGGAYEKPICRGGLPEKEGAWTVIPQCTLWLPMIQ